MEQITVVIPAYKPDEKMLTTLGELVKAGFSDIFVVNDGSGEEFNDIFEAVKKMPECTLLVHPENKGKGAALKTAFRYFLDNREDKKCIVSADADGQHLTKDIIATATAALEQEKVVLGVRDFTDPNVPQRSKMGNQITCGVFRLFFGMKIQDTQTGLRAFPRKYLEEILKAKGDRYEYETNMLFIINRKNIPLDEVKIETVYIEENKSSHFRVVRDSVRIYALILKYLLSSVGSAIVDEIAFFIFKNMGFLLGVIPIPLTFTAAILARVISSLFNFFVNAKVVFNEKAGAKSFVKYYILAAVQISISAAVVFLMEKVLHIESPALSTIIKAVVDTILFFFSFRIQHKWVFNDGKTNGKDA